jgi:hypothetical protein
MPDSQRIRTELEDEVVKLLSAAEQIADGLAGVPDRTALERYKLSGMDAGVIDAPDGGPLCSDCQLRMDF